MSRTTAWRRRKKGLGPDGRTRPKAAYPTMPARCENVYRRCRRPLPYRACEGLELES